jgi:hypothetical protein
MRRILAGVFAVTVVCPPIHAQGTIQYPTTVMHDVSSPYPANQLDTKARIGDMKAALRDLITAQEKYFNDHGTYTTDGSALGIYPAKSGQPFVQVIFAGSRGWTGIATDRAWKGKSCVVYVGFEKELPGGVPKTMGGIVAKAEGVPACDEP